MPLFGRRRRPVEVQEETDADSTPPSSSAVTSEVWEDPWRNVEWGQKEEMKDELKMLQISNPEIEHLRCLVFGPVGAGKSSFINTVQSIFLERMASLAPVSQIGSRSFTKGLKTHYIQKANTESFLSFAICDIMGVENSHSEGIRTDDLIKVLEGHITEGYMFIPTYALSENDNRYNKRPTVNDQIHCLITVIPADKVSLIPEATINKMSEVRDKAAYLGIPQVAVLTKIDETCPEVAKDIKLVYRSKKIKDKMEECSMKLGIPKNMIFPIRNYYEETQLINDVDELLLSALKHILNFAKDHVVLPPSADRLAKKNTHANQANGQVANLATSAVSNL